MDVLSDLLPTDHKQSVTMAVATQALLTFCFAISSFVAADNDNAGFNVILTSLQYVAFVAGAFYVLTRFPTALHVGFLIGVGATLCLTSLMTAVYWGQLAGCNPKHSGELAQCTCNNVAAMRAVCAFASLQFLAQAGFTAMLITWKDDLTDETSNETAYSDIGGAPPPSLYDGGAAAGGGTGGLGSYKYAAGPSATADL